MNRTTRHNLQYLASTNVPRPPLAVTIKTPAVAVSDDLAAANAKILAAHKPSFRERQKMQGKV